MIDRLPQALARAAELISYPHLPKKYANWLAGWAQAVEALSEEHLGHYDRYDCNGCKSVATFITAMLGEEKSDE